MACAITLFLVPPIVFSILGFISLSILSLPLSRVGGPWFSLSLHLYTPCWIFQMISLCHIWGFETIQLETVSAHTWYPCWTTSLKWGGYCNSSGPCTSTILLWTPSTPPTHSYWYPYSLWIVGIMRWSRGWMAASKFLSRFPHQWRSCSSILKYVVWIWGYCVLNETSL